MKTHLSVPAAVSRPGYARPLRSVPHPEVPAKPASSFEAKAFALAPQERGVAGAQRVPLKFFFQALVKAPAAAVFGFRPVPDPWAGIGAPPLSCFSSARPDGSLRCRSAPSGGVWPTSPTPRLLQAIGRPVVVPADGLRASRRPGCEPDRQAPLPPMSDISDIGHQKCAPR